MDRNKIARIRAIVKKALDEAFKDENLSVTQGVGKYGPTELNFKLKFVEGKVLSYEEKAEADFRKHCRHFGLAETDLGRLARLHMRGGKFMEVSIIGLLPDRRNDNIILVKTIDNKQYCVSVDDIKKGFESMENRVSPVVKQTGYRSEERILSEIRGIHLDLEPDTLSAYGKRPAPFVEKMKKELQEKLELLHKELGRIPTNEEIWSMS